MLNQFWQFIDQQIKQSSPFAMLFVLESTGSSPGRQGFKMAINGAHQMLGSIGGGIMEHKLIEQTKEMIAAKSDQIYYRQQIHNKKATKDQSGMICSGEQWICMLYINQERTLKLRQILEAFKGKQNHSLILNASGFSLKATLQSSQYEFRNKTAANWEYQEQLNFRKQLYIIGAGHVSLAFSKIMSNLNFDIHIFDQRKDLNTFEQNDFATQKHIMDYDQIVGHIPEGANSYVVLISFGYRIDKLVLRPLLDKEFRYLGMMGSQTKVDQLFKEYKEEGVDPALLEKVKSPIGIKIGSKTPEEIAISIAAEIIATYNR